MSKRAERCADCYYFQPAPVAEADGDCRRSAPGSYRRERLMPLAGTRYLTLERIETPFPPTPPDGWCGDFEPRRQADGP